MADKKVWPQARNPKRYMDGSILSEVQYEEGGPWLPHSSASDAGDPRNVALYKRIDSGEFGKVAPYTTQEKKAYTVGINQDEQQALFNDAVAVVRSLSDLELMGLLDEEGAAKMKAWRAYGKAVKEVDLTVEFPEWPAQPGSEDNERSV